MNSQVTVLDRNGQPMNVELICYFSNGAKKYAFYTKNETYLSCKGVVLEKVKEVLDMNHIEIPYQKGTGSIL